MSASSELKREREVQGYAQSWKAAQGSSVNVALSLDSIELYELRGNGYTPRASRDKALTAFAQLAVLRLNVKRAMISLIDKSAQHVLTEATRSLRLGDSKHRQNQQRSKAEERHDDPTTQHASTNSSATENRGGAVTPNDLWLGASIIARSDAICEHVLSNTCTANDDPEPEPEQRYTTNGLIVPNCQNDPRFQNRKIVQSNQGVRFYAGVPIVSSSGHKIGVYAVLDESPRHGLTTDELQFMEDVAQAVMEHLEWARDRVDRFKGERIVRGLASFIEGCSSAACDGSKDNQAAKDCSGVRPPEMTLTTASRYSPLRMESRELENDAGMVSREASAGLRIQDGGASASATESCQSLKKKPTKSKADAMSIMFHRASEILRQATFADGVILFGATATNSKGVSRALRSGGLRPADDFWMQGDTSSGSENRPSMESSDSDTSPAARPCSILSYSLADEKARADIEQGTPLSLGALDTYFSLFPRGKTFSFTDEGAGLSSEEDSASDREPSMVVTTGGDSVNEGPEQASTEQQQQPRRRRKTTKMNHRELLKKIPGAKAVVFVPLYDYTEDRLYGGCFLWTSVTGRLINLDADLSYLRAFGNAIMSSVGRINTLKNEAAKTTFIASISHELRSPLHGILGAAEFLHDTIAETYQLGLIDAITVCGKSLLDTLNHVLDYSKINRLSGPQKRAGGGSRHMKLSTNQGSSMESMNITAVVDLAALVEEVVNVISAGHTLQQHPDTSVPRKPMKTPGGFHRDLGPRVLDEAPVSIILDIDPSISWKVKTQPGALRRIIMNLFGNALKYTSKGSVVVSLRGQPNADSTKLNVLIRVVDTGKGISEEFRRTRLFVPFSQEDSFQPGTGLGLSIVKQIVDSLRGSLEVKSEQDQGTEVDVRLRLPRGPGDNDDDDTSAPYDEHMKSIFEKTKGKQMLILNPRNQQEQSNAGQQGCHFSTCHKLSNAFAETCTKWFGISVTYEGSGSPSVVENNPDFYVYSVPPPPSLMKKRLEEYSKLATDTKWPVVIMVCPNAEEAARASWYKAQFLGSLSVLAEVVSQPCGPRKLAKIFNNCMTSAAMMPKISQALPSIKVEQPSVDDTNDSNLSVEAKVDEVTTQRIDQEPKQNGAATESTPIPPPTQQEPQPPKDATPSSQPPAKEPSKANPEKPNLHILVVDDNKINLQLLVMFMKKCGFTYESAENGQEALEKFTTRNLTLDNNNNDDENNNNNKKRFDYILMDISMPVMNGIESTKRIRAFERENSLPRTNVIALTGLASADTRKEADSAGMDIYLPKPVKFAELKTLLSLR